jgi:putative ubiquitin-RnfH superfamily antitoxin RatB of RatAB toxin-antitoxin module
MANAEATIAVEVAWSPEPRRMRTTALRLPCGATVAQALRATGWPELAEAADSDAALAAAGLAVAVWARGRALDAALRDGDRVEVLRALTIAPMDARRARYEAAGGIKALRRRKLEAQFKR